MKLVLRKKDEKQKDNVVNSIKYTDMPLDYLRDEYPEIYNEIIRKYKGVDSYIYMRNM
ncbi:hypothetical protein [Acidianus sulfidivorans]|uniref:hypothetical protein n=1 Tax=Acidianus sulfidivorans TaxID=312539 RepID=UPI0013A56E22|nr:hypothetical protein [Acidianus sulfidivorans]